MIQRSDYQKKTWSEGQLVNSISETRLSIIKTAGVNRNIWIQSLSIKQPAVFVTDGLSGSNRPCWLIVCFCWTLSPVQASFMSLDEQMNSLATDPVWFVRLQVMVYRRSCPRRHNASAASAIARVSLRSQVASIRRSVLTPRVCVEFPSESDWTFN